MAGSAFVRAVSTCDSLLGVHVGGVASGDVSMSGGVSAVSGGSGRGKSNVVSAAEGDIWSRRLRSFLRSRAAASRLSDVLVLYIDEYIHVRDKMKEKEKDKEKDVKIKEKGVGQCNISMQPLRNSSTYALQCMHACSTTQPEGQGGGTERKGRRRGAWHLSTQLLRVALLLPAELRGASRMLCTLAGSRRNSSRTRWLEFWDSSRPESVGAEGGVADTERGVAASGDAGTGTGV